jgi:uncharacterized protein (TIGR02611 family)
VARRLDLCNPKAISLTFSVWRRMRKMTSKMAYDLKQVRRVVVFVAGIVVLLLGIAMLVAPGPGILTVALGLGILAMEFVWARRLLKRLRRLLKRLREKGTNFANRLFRKGATVLPVVSRRVRSEKLPRYSHLRRHRA